MRSRSRTLVVALCDGDINFLAEGESDREPGGVLGRLSGEWRREVDGGEVGGGKGHRGGGGRAELGRRCFRHQGSTTALMRK